MIRQAAVALLVLLGACTADDRPVADARLDARVDRAPLADHGSAPDLGPKPLADGAVTSPKLAGTLMPVQYTGRISWGPAKPGAPQGTFLNFEPSFEPPYDAVIKPDFLDAPNPPNCVGYTWSKTGQTFPQKTTADAGKVTVTGHKAVKYVDADSPTATPQDLPTTLECRRQPLGTTGRYTYDCGLPERAMLVGGPTLDDTTRLTFGVAGGKDVAAFTEQDVAAPLVKPAPGFDMNQIDPQSIKATWEPTSAALVGLVITAHLEDYSQIFQLRCSQLAIVGSITVPAAALALIPRPTQATNRLIISTVLVATNPTVFPSRTMPWGTSMVGAGRGAIGMSCRLPDGTQCP